MKSSHSISLHRENGFPYGEYAFTDSMVSAVVEHNGGIDELGFIYIVEKDGHQYPGLKELYILSRDNMKYYKHINSQQMFYGPPLRFFSSHHNGPNLYHFPQKVDIYPFGFNSSWSEYGIETTYRLCIKDRFIIFSFENHAAHRNRLKLVLYRAGLFCGVISPEETEEPVSEKRKLDLEYHRKSRVKIIWHDLQFDIKQNWLATQGTLEHRFGTELLSFVISANSVITAEQLDDQIILSLDWSNHPNTRAEFYLLLEPDFATAAQRIEYLKTDSGNIWKNQIERYKSIAKTIPKLQINGFPSAKQFFGAAPLILNSMILTEENGEACIRAANHGYAFAYGWDQIFQARGMVAANHVEVAKKLIHYVGGPVFKEQNDCYLSMITVAINDCINATRDKNVLKEFYPLLKRIAETVLSHCDNYGFFNDTTSLGVDDPLQLGINGWGRVVTPDGIGFWYNACRIIENAALAMRDEELAVQMRDIATKIEKNYLKVFFDPDVGYLCVSADAKTYARNRIFQNVVTMAMEGPYGDCLLGDKIYPIGEFITNQLAHPRGRVAVPIWCRAAEMWHSAHMQQHAAHEAKTLRYAGQGAELMRMFQIYMDLFATHDCCIETNNLTPLPDNLTQDRKWYGIAASAWYSMIIEGMLGIEVDWGGLTYIPCDTPITVQLKQLYQAGCEWSVFEEGDGPWVERFEVDSQFIEGLFKIPGNALRAGGKHRIKITRGVNPPRLPTLLRAPGVEVDPIHISQCMAEYDLFGWARVPLKFYTTKQPKIQLNGQSLDVYWKEGTNIARAEALVLGKARVHVEL